MRIGFASDHRGYKMKNELIYGESNPDPNGDTESDYKEENNKFCTKCGSKVELNDKFCPSRENKLD